MAIPAALIQQDKLLMNKVSTLATATVSKNLPDLSALSQDEAGGVFRTLSTGAITSFGSAASQTARLSYDKMALATVGKSKFKAGALENFPEFVTANVDPVVGFAMSKFQDGLFDEAGSSFSAAVGRAVSNSYRETSVQNTANDNRTRGAQRVASAGACAFCAFAAAMAEIAIPEDGFHDHCSCSMVPVFDGEEAYRPAYYDDYYDAAGSAQNDIRLRDSVDRKAFFAENPDAKKRDYFRAYPENAMNTKNILAGMRQQGFA